MDAHLSAGEWSPAAAPLVERRSRVRALAPGHARAGRLGGLCSVVRIAVSGSIIRPEVRVADSSRLVIFFKIVSTRFFAFSYKY